MNDFHLLTLTDRRTDGQVYNLGSGSNYSVGEIFDLIADVLGLEPRLEPVYEKELPGDTKVTLADISQTLELGWKPKTDIADGIKGSVEYLRHVMERDRKMRMEQKRAE